MFKMKRILGILLAVCFLMSVTVAAVSAEPLKIGGEHGKKIGDKDDRDKMKRGHFEKGHFEWKLVNEYKKIHHHWVVVKVWKYVWVPAHDFR
jgi:hypothetical protein